MVDCSYCGKQIKENAIRCIHCGKYLDGKSPHGGANIDTRHILDASGENVSSREGYIEYFLTISMNNRKWPFHTKDAPLAILMCCFQMQSSYIPKKKLWGKLVEFSLLIMPSILTKTNYLERRKKFESNIMI